MRFLAEPWRFILAWTALCAIPVIFLVGGALEPAPEQCIDYCGFGGTMAGLLIPLIALLWLGVIGLVLWAFRRTEG